MPINKQISIHYHINELIRTLGASGVDSYFIRIITFKKFSGHGFSFYNLVAKDVLLHNKIIRLFEK